jgi:sulfur carrier protein
MRLTVNGDSKEIGQTPASITDLLKACSVEMPEMVSVQLNGTFVDRSLFGVTAVRDGDVVDFLYFMGGGAGRDLNQSTSQARRDLNLRRSAKICGRSRLVPLSGETRESPQMCAD